MTQGSGLRMVPWEMIGDCIAWMLTDSLLNLLVNLVPGYAQFGVVVGGCKIWQFPLFV